MTLFRVASLLVLAVASTSAFAADPNSTPASSSEASSVTLDSIHLAPWFTGTKGNDSQPAAAGRTKTAWSRTPAFAVPGALNEVSCLTLRTYMVKRTERLTDNESAARGYTTCQPVSNYQIRTEVGTHELKVLPQ